MIGPATAATSPPQPPVAAKHPHAFTLHGEAIQDDYAWLRDKKDPNVIAYLQAENAYADTLTNDQEPLRKQLYDEMLARIQQTDLSVPYRKGGYLYYSRTEEGKQYPILCRKQGDEQAPEHVMLDLTSR
jgi:oligopeptidase B